MLNSPHVTPLKARKIIQNCADFNSTGVPYWCILQIVENIPFLTQCLLEVGYERYQWLEKACPGCISEIVRRKMWVLCRYISRGCRFATS